MDTLCRKCGESLLEFSFCVECKEPIQQICSVCKRMTEEQYHKDCVYRLQILKLFPIPPDKVFERRKILPAHFLGDFVFIKKDEEIFDYTV